MKTKVAPISTFARPAALTQREWEALARLAVVVETTLFDQVDDRTLTAGYGPVPVPASVYAALLNELRRAIRDAGLVPDEWFVFLRPHLDNHQAPKRITDWTLEMRLIPSISAAKSSASTAEHKPTLSEQFEVKK
jgi:hypothetical protein